MSWTRAAEISNIGTFILTVILLFLMVSPISPPTNANAGQEAEVQAMSTWLSVSVLTVALVVAALLHFAAAWYAKHPSKKDKRVLLLCRLRKIGLDYLELMRRFPQSTAVANPLGTGWRPLVGDVDVKEDVRQVLAWHKETGAFFRELTDNFPEAKTIPFIQDYLAFGDNPMGPSYIAYALFSGVYDFLWSGLFPSSKEN